MMNRFIISISILTFTFNLSAQFEIEKGVENYTHVIKSSPTASGLGQFGEYSVGGASGIPGISIPLTSINCNTINLPLSLSYRGGGVKVNDISSWIGTGWSLNAGGVITRTINGNPDDMPYSLKDLYDTGYDPNNSSVGPTTWDLATHVNKLYDGEADMFSFNFLNFSGSFYFAPDATNNYTPQLIDHADLRIEYDESGDHFTIWDTQGTKYTFEETEFSTSTTSIPGNPLNQGTTAWYLTEIESKYEVIDFVYEQGTTVNYQVGNSVTQTTALHSSNASFFSDGEPGEPQLQIEKKYLKSINASNGESIVFTRAPRTDLTGFEKLEYFTHFTGNVNPVKYDFLSSDVNNRLFLDEVQITSVGSDTQKYVLEYNTQTVLADRFGGQDLWGYNNGGSYTHPTIPSHGISGGNRAVDALQTLAGTLEGITYPTGGKTEFVWENNEISGQETVAQEVNYSVTFNENDWNASGLATKLFTLGNTSQINLEYDIDTYQAAPQEPEMDGSIQFNLVKDGEVILSDLQSGSASNLDLGRLKDGSYSIELENDLGPASVFNFDLEINWSEPTGTTQTVPYNYLIGGLRIKSIINKDEQGNELNRKTFEYSNPIAFDNVQPTDFVVQIAAYELQDAGTSYCTIFKTHYAYRASNNRQDGGSALDYPAIYSTITEYNGTATQNNGKIVRTYYPPDAGASTSNPFSAPAFVYNTLQMEQLYDANNNEVKRTTYDYEFIERSTRTSVSASFELKNGCQPAGVYSALDRAVSNSYLLKSRWKKLNSITTIDYLGSRQIEQQVTYNYFRPDQHVNPNEVTRTGSDGLIEKVVRLYPRDYGGISTTANNLRDYYSGLEMESVRLKDGKVQSGRLYEFNSSGELLNIYETTFENPVDANTFSYSCNTSEPQTHLGDFTIEAHYDNLLASFDYYSGRVGQVKHITQKDVTTTYLWGHNRVYPVCKATNIDLAGIQAIPGFSLTTLETSISEPTIQSELEKIRLGLNQSQSLMGYTYEIGHGMKWSIDQNGKITEYTYDGLGRLIKVEDEDGNILQENQYNYGN